MMKSIKAERQVEMTDFYNTLHERLLTFGREVVEHVRKSLADGEIQQETSIEVRWKIDGFQYTSDGPRHSQARGEEVEVTHWSRGSLLLSRRLHNFPLFNEILDLSKKNFPNDDHYSTFVGYLQHVISKALMTGTENKIDLEPIAEVVIKEIKREPILRGAIIELDGIIMMTSSIEFNAEGLNVKLRQTAASDLKNYDIRYSAKDAFAIPPSAILEISFLGKAVYEIQANIQKALTILRLFKVGSVMDLSYKMFSDSVRPDNQGRVSHANRLSPLETYKLSDEDAEPLKSFWISLSLEYDRVFKSTEPTPVAIATDRYFDVLLKNGSPDARIAHAVMSLESLYLLNNDELSYRLSMGIAKIFGLFDDDPVKLKKLIQTAYNIRSKFVHGSHPTKNEQNEITKHYGGLAQMLALLLPYVRKSIILSIFTKKEKADFSNLINNSMISDNAHKLLASLVDPLKELCGNN